jgi:hypothetical protein
MENKLRVSIVADASGVEAGFSDAAQSVEQFNQRMAAAMERYNAVASQGKVAQEALNAAFEKASASGKTVVEAYEAAAAACEQMTVAATQAAVADNSLALAQTAASASAKDFAASQGMAAASARLAGRELGGSVGGQLGRIAGMSESLGPLLSNPFIAAIPIIGAVGIVVYELVESFMKAQKQAEAAAEIIDREWRKAAESIETQNDSLMTQGDRLQEKLDKLLGHPSQNGLSIAFDEAVEASNKLNITIDSNIEKMQQLLSLENEKNSIGFWGSLVSGKAETGDTQKLVLNAVSGIQKARDEFDGVIKATEELNDKAKLNDAQERELAKLQVAYDKAEKSITDSISKIQEKQENWKETGIGKDQAANLNILRGALADLDAQQKNIGEQFRNENLQQQTAPLQLAKGGARQPNYEQMLAAQQLFEGKSLGAAELYWENVVKTTGTHQEQLLRAQEAYEKQINETGKLSGLRHPDTTAAPENFPATVDLSKHKQTEAEANEAINRSLEEQAKKAQEIYEYTMRTIELKEKAGQLSPAQADTQRIAASQTLQNTDVTAAKTQQQAIGPPVSNAQLDEYNQLQQKMTAAADKGSQQREMVVQQEADRQSQQFQRMFTAMTTPMNTFVDHWLTSGRRMGAAFEQMGDQMAMNFINAEMRMLENHIRIELQKQAATTTSNALQTQNTVTANGLKSASDTTTATESISKKAADAAAGAWNALSNIPIVGPVLGAAAAGATWAGVMSLAAFETGTNYVPKTGMALIHEGEAVANRGEASDMRKLISMGQKSRQGGDNHFHMGTTINALDGSGVEGVANRNSAALMKAVRRQMRLSGRIQ